MIKNGTINPNLGRKGNKVITIDIARISRNAIEVEELLKIIKENNYELELINESIDFRYQSVEQAEATQRMLAILAQQEANK